MSLSDIMGNMDLSVYPQIGLIIFLAVFAGVMARTFSRVKRREYERLGAMAMEEPLPAQSSTQTRRAMQASDRRQGT